MIWYPKAHSTRSIKTSLPTIVLMENTVGRSYGRSPFIHVLMDHDILVALPWYADYGLFFYRKDLLDKYGLQPPKTWDDLEDTASIILTGERGEHPALAGLVGQLDGKDVQPFHCTAP